MRVVYAEAAFLLDIRNLAICRDLAIVAGDAATRKRGETEEANKAHHMGLPTDAEQVPYRKLLFNGCEHSRPGPRFFAPERAHR